MIDRDQTHGYGYLKSGCIVTSICAEGSADGRPVYLSPADVYRSCCDVGLPTDLPILVEGEANIQKFVGTLSVVRDILTLGALRKVLADQGVDLKTMHDEVIDSHIVEGFVIRRWKDDTEVESIKFKIWLYQMVTQVLRPSLNGKFSTGAVVPSLKDSDGNIRHEFLRLANQQMEKWCVVSEASTRTLCRWVIRAAAGACLPAGHEQLQWSGAADASFPTSPAPPDCVSRDPRRGYWISLADHAVQKLVSLLNSVDWDVNDAAEQLKHSEAWRALADIDDADVEGLGMEEARGKARGKRRAKLH